MGLKIKSSERFSQGKEAAMKEVLSEKKIRVNFEVDASFHKKLKLKSVQENKTIKDIIVNLLNGYLS